MKSEHDPRGLFSPDSITWKIHSDASMAVGGIRALLEQALHPVAMAGVASHSNFRDDAWGRLQRTGDYVSTLTFAPTQDALALSARVRKVHTTLGLDDPHLLLWVHMAMVDSFLDVAIRSGLALSESEQNQYLSEMVLFAELVGINGSKVPKSVEEMQKYFVDISKELEASDDAKRAALFLTIPPMPKVVRFATPAAPAWASLTALAGASLAPWAKRLYRLPQIPGDQKIIDLSLRASRSTLSVLPTWLLTPPLLKAARERWKISA
ncbi:unannotated protein [freshwater metagenome]|uniref:Unannotated protein n=1 Tax=freshwater metagenome TaxID=449393 RepID=A0A6J7E7A6_9ZZZZ|nr:DUF2236 domain-containing protein [Actinomycetota bacterium]